MNYYYVVDKIGEIVDAAGVAVTVVGAVIAGGIAAVRLAHHQPGTYHVFRQQLGQAILLGLELLVAGDIVRTVATTPTLADVGILAVIVLIRTFLSFSLELELTGHWLRKKDTSLSPPGNRTTHSSRPAPVQPGGGGTL